MEREIYFKELAYMIVEAWRVVQNLECANRWRCRGELQFKSKDSLLTEFLLAQGRSVFVLVR